MESYDEVLLWSIDEWNRGNRIKASKLRLIFQKMQRKHEHYILQSIKKHVERFY